MSIQRNQQQGSKNYERFLRLFRIIQRYRESVAYRWIHSHQKLALILVIALGAAILLVLIGFLIAGIALVR